MKRNLIKLILCAGALIGVAGILSCGPSAPPANQQPVSGNETNLVETTSIFGPDEACDDPVPSNKLTRIRTRIIEKINRKLKEQLEDHKTFKFVVQDSQEGSYIEVYIEGIVYGSDQLKSLADALNDFKKKGCLLRVFFVPSGTIAPGRTLRAAGFEWRACEYPEKVCTDGSCKEVCFAASNSAANTGNNGNSANRGSGSNSNTGSNTNTAANSNGTTHGGP